MIGLFFLFGNDSMFGYETDWTAGDPYLRMVEFEEEKARMKAEKALPSKRMDPVFSLRLEEFKKNFPDSNPNNDIFSTPKINYEGLAYLLAYGRKLAISRYKKKEQLPKVYIAGIQNKNYIIQITRLFFNNINYTFTEERESELNLILSVINSMCSSNTVSYRKTAMIRDYIINFVIYKEDLESKRNKLFLKNYLSAIRLYFLLQEEKLFETMIRQQKISSLIFLYDSLYGQNNIDVIQLTHSIESSVIYSPNLKPLLYFYPAFIREKFELLISNKLTGEETKKSSISSELRDYFSYTKYVIRKKRKQ